MSLFDLSLPTNKHARIDAKHEEHRNKAEQVAPSKAAVNKYWESLV